MENYEEREVEKISVHGTTVRKIKNGFVLFNLVYTNEELYAGTPRRVLEVIQGDLDNEKEKFQRWVKSLEAKYKKSKSNKT